MDAWWRWIWKRKNPWYDAWKDAEFQIFHLRAQYEPGFLNAPCLITDRHRAVGQGVQQVQEGGDDGVPPPPEQRASVSPVLGLALPIGLGGQYAQSIKQGQEEHVLTRFKF